MPLLKDGELTPDPWRDVADDEPLPAEQGVIVSAERWLSTRETLRGRNAPFGIRLTNAQSVADIADALDSVGVVVLDFPAFADGRAFSQVRLLRERYDFKGEIRSRGTVRRDLYPFMRRCGFDAFEVEEGADIAGWAASDAAMSHAYQPAADGVQAVWAKRHGGAS